MTHRHYLDETVCVEIGPGVCLAEHRSHAGELTRFVFSHDFLDDLDREARGGLRCEGSVPITGTEHPVWTATGSLAMGNLTLSPSILCKGPSGCGGIHGFVRSGKWVPA